ncbi:MAG: hypothetical protein LQ348_006595 [Seirophora lacunosa]|nr:MAG: hypothetical protein LQ348_006595 [Seirophora lacunosa]
MSMDMREDYQWTEKPLIIGAPMRLISLAPLAVAVSRGGGIGFLGAGTDVHDLEMHLQEASRLIEQAPISGGSPSVLPIGVGFINWGAHLETAVQAIGEFKPAAVWFFAPHENEHLVQWTEAMRKATDGMTKVWIQVGSVRDALEVAEFCRPDVIVVQGSDAGGHGLERSSGIISLFPETADALRDAGFGHIALVAAGGIVDGRGVAACLTLGTAGVVMGTRFLASTEASIAKGYQDAVLRTKDGGVSTARSKVYDILRGTTGWPERIGGRGIINQSFLDAKDGRVTEENKKAHAEALEQGDLGWAEDGRLTAYAGTGVGLISSVKPAGDILKEIREQAQDFLSRSFSKISKL